MASTADSIERDVHDIAFLLEQSLLAAEKPNHVEKMYSAEQALNLLERATTVGHFELAKTEPIRKKQLLSDQAG